MQALRPAPAWSELVVLTVSSSGVLAVGPVSAVSVSPNCWLKVAQSTALAMSTALVGAAAAGAGGVAGLASVEAPGAEWVVGASGVIGVAVAPPAAAGGSCTGDCAK